LPELHPGGKNGLWAFCSPTVVTARGRGKNRIGPAGQNILRLVRSASGVGKPAPPPIRNRQHGVPNYRDALWQPRNNIRDPPAGMSAGLERFDLQPAN